MNMFPKNNSLSKLYFVLLLLGIAIVAVLVNYAIISRGIINFICIPAITVLVAFATWFFLKNISCLFWLFIFSLPFTEVGILNIGNLTLYPSQLLVLSFAFLWFLYNVAKDKTFKIPKTPLDIPLALFLMIVVLSIYQSYNIPANYEEFVYDTIIRNKPFIKSISQVMFILPGILSYYMTVAFLKSKESVIKAVKVWLFAMAVVSFYGIYQFVGYYLKLPFAGSLIHTYDIVTFKSLIIARVSSVTTEPTFLPVYLVTILPLAMVIFLRKIDLVRKRYILKILILSSVLCYMLTFSKNGVLMFLCICVFMVYLMKYWNLKIYRRIIAIIFIMITLTLIFFHHQLFQALKLFWDTTSYHSYQLISAFHRMVCFKTAFNMFLRHPLLGVGVGNFDFNFLENIPGPHIIELMRHTGMPRTVNNIYLETLAETGMFGFAFFICVLCFLIKEPLRRIKHMKDRYWDTLLLGLTIGFVGILAANLTLSIFYFPFVWALMGLITATERVSRD